MAGGVAALVAALVFRRNIGAEVMLLRLLGVLQSGPTVEPASAAGWFDLFQSDPLVAFTLFGLFDLVNYGILAHGAMLVYLVTWTLPAVIRAIPPSLSGLSLFVWYILIGIKLLKLGSMASKA